MVDFIGWLLTPVAIGGVVGVAALVVGVPVAFVAYMVKWSIDRRGADRDD